jgi:hypothetical protein
MAHPRLAELYADYLGPALGADATTLEGGAPVAEEDILHPSGVPKMLDTANVAVVCVGDVDYVTVSQVANAFGLSTEGQSQKSREMQDLYEAITHPVEYNNGIKTWWVEHRLIPVARVAEFICSFQTHRVTPEMRPALVQLKTLLRERVTAERANRKSLLEEQSRVYVFDRGDVVKVGISADTAQHKRQLESSAGIDIVRVFETAPSHLAPQVEALCHKILQKRRVKGEWFRGPFEKIVPIVEEVYRRAHIGDKIG